MKETILARRYARGLAEHAVELNQLDTVRGDLMALADLLDPDRGEISVPELLTILMSPTVTPAEKIKLTDVVCDKMKVGKTVSDFLNVLIKRNRVGLVSYIATEFDRISSSYESVTSVTVESAKSLGEKQRKALEAALAEAAGGSVRVQYRTNPHLMAGASVQVGDLRLDGSIAHRLDSLHQHLD